MMGGPRPMMGPPHPMMMGPPHPMMMGHPMGGGVVPRPIMLPPPPMMIPVRRTSVNPATSVTTKKKVGKITLYHLTSITAGKAIKKSGKMLRGSSGWFGVRIHTLIQIITHTNLTLEPQGGIYFAKSIQICARKSKNGTDCVIKAQVNMGKALVIDANTCNTKYTYTKLKKMGCNSVIAKGIATGDEFVVFNYGQVKILSIKDKNGGNI